MASSIPSHLAPSTSTLPPSQNTPRAPRNRPSPQPSPQHTSPRSTSPRSTNSSALDVETLLKTHGGDVRKALEVVVADRNQLQAQNSQLWKLIEKQRSQSSHLNNDNERLRADRERANGKLAAAGMDPVGNVRRLPNSSSAMGLGIQADTPAVSVARRNSERDKLKDETPKLQTPSTEPIPQNARNTPQLSTELSPPINATPQVPLLPSAMPSKLRHESRMIFPSEVNSFMALADSPKEASHTVTAIPASTSNTTLSPTSQYSSYSPSPKHTVKEESPGVAIPPSSRQLAVMTEEDEGEDGTANLAPPRLSSLNTPSMESASTHSSFNSSAQPSPPQQRPRQEDSTRASVETTRRTDPARPSIDTETYPFHRDPSPKSHQGPFPRPSQDSRATVAESFAVSGMTPQLLPHSRISVPDTTIYPNSLGRDVLCFIVNVSVRPPNAPPISWNVAKLLSAFMDLDTNLKNISRKTTKEWKSIVAPLPDGKAWKDFAPSKIDQRKTALEAYLKSIQVAPLSDKSYLCDFLSADVVQAKAPGQRKEGYLTKRNKRWGGWTTRYFVLDGPVLEYSDTRGGRASGSITITNAQIGRQNNKPSDVDDGEYKHAFLIIEQKKGVAVRHVLCAPSDLDRERWIESLVLQVDPKPAPSMTPIASSSSTIPQQAAPMQSQPSQPSASTSTGPMGLQRKRSASRKSSKDVIVTNAQPMASMPTTGKFANAPSPGMINSLEAQKSHSQSSQHSSSNGSSSAPMSQSSTLMSVSETSQSMMTDRSNGRSSASHDSSNDPTPRPGKRQSSVPPRYTPAYLTKLSTDGMNAPPGSMPDHKDRDRKAKSGRFWPSFGKTPEKITRPVFGVPLNESLAIASVASLPAVVFRCIEWLETNKAQDEEGIYRMSGSSAVIKGLKERFDQEGDVNLTKLDDRWDPHAIAGLLKSFLRDLPTGLLTRDLHPKFLAVMDLIDSSARVAELARLVSELPPPNYALLRSLTAHLILIVKHSSTNKMTLRNIGIVFSPTLGIPAGIFSELVSHFGAIFDAEEEIPEIPEDVVEISAQPASTSNPIDERSGLRPINEDADNTMKRNRNSVLYQAAGADAMLGIGGRSLDPTAVDDSASEVSEMDDYDSETHSQAPSHLQSAHSSEDHSTSNSPTTPRADRYPSATAVRKAKAAARVLSLDQNESHAQNGNGNGNGMGNGHGHGHGGLPSSPRHVPVINEGVAR